MFLYTFSMETIAVVTTIDSAERARAIATALVERKLAACVQITPIESVYRWQGTTHIDNEYRVMAKTIRSRYAEVEATIRELHTYELPAVFAFEVTEAYAPYLDWVAENSAG